MAQTLCDRRSIEQTDWKALAAILPHMLDDDDRIYVREPAVSPGGTFGRRGTGPVNGAARPGRRPATRPGMQARTAPPQPLIARYTWRVSLVGLGLSSLSGKLLQMMMWAPEPVSLLRRRMIAHFAGGWLHCTDGRATGERAWPRASATVPCIGRAAKSCMDATVNGQLTTGGEEPAQHFLYFRPEPHGHGSLRPILTDRTGSRRGRRWSGLRQ